MVDDTDKMDGDSGDFGSKGNGVDDEEIHIEVLDPDAPSSYSDDPEEELEDPAVELAVPGIEKKLGELQREKDDLYDRLLRKQADFENYRKRAEKEKREFQQYALSAFVLDLIPILDNFERALSHMDEELDAQNRRGVELIYRQLRDAMEKKGLRPVETEGHLFDPNFHEAIGRELRDDLPENTILEELQKGYFFHDRLLRPALVKVSHKSDETEQPGPPQDLEREKKPDQENGEEWENNES